MKKGDFNIYLSTLFFCVAGWLMHFDYVKDAGSIGLIGLALLASGLGRRL